MQPVPGPIVLLGSGETSSTIRAVYDWLFRRLAAPIQVAILETPAGFEPNSAQVADAIRRFLEERLQNYRPQIAVIPARRRGTEDSPDNAALLEPLFAAQVLFMGPGSPTYAVRQLRDSLAWHMLRARHRLGAALILASAATLAASRWTLPVYEIYKVGEDLHWKPGLDLLGDFGLPTVFVPHWNNNDGGKPLDTSRCFMGRERFERLAALLPAQSPLTLVGIDEKTALVVDLAAGVCRVFGAGGVTLLMGESGRFEGGATFPAAALGPLHLPEGAAGLPAALWQEAVERVAGVSATAPGPPPAVLDLAAARSEVRRRRDWTAADALRQAIEELGWEVRDTPQGSTLVPR